MIDILKDIGNIEEFVSQYPKETVICTASVRGMPISIFKAFEREDIKYILPVIFIKGIEYNGATQEDYYNHWLMINKRVKELYGDSKILFEPLIYNNIELWRLFNVKYANTINDIYKVSNICLTCKAYFTIVQCHIACLFNKDIIIGEKPNKDKTKFGYDLIRDGKLLNCDSYLFNSFNIKKIKLINYETKLDDVKYLFPNEWFYLKESSCLFEKSWKVIDSKKIKSDFNDLVIDEYIKPLSQILISELNKNFQINKDDLDVIISNYIRMVKKEIKNV